MEIEPDREHGFLKSFSIAAVSLFLVGLVGVATQFVFSWISDDNPYARMFTSAWGGIATACLLARAFRQSQMNDVLKGALVLSAAATTAVALFLVLGLLV